MFLEKTLSRCLLILSLLCPIQVAAESGTNFVVLPTSDIKLDTGQLARISKSSDWNEAIRAYTDTSDRAVSVWCNDISESQAALAVSAKSISEIGLANCPNADSSHAMTIKVPKELIPETYGNMSGLEGDYLYLFLRSANNDSHTELTGVGQRILWEPYSDQAGDLFSVEVGGPKDTFFPNFCQMCGCCSNGLE